MKFIIFNILLLSSIQILNSQCVMGKNCPPERGICKAGVCECFYNFWTLKNLNQLNSTQSYCNYQKTSKFLPLLLEFFIPSLGHFYSGRYVHGLIKLGLFLVPVIIMFYVFISSKKNNNNKGDTEGVHYGSRENDELEEKNDDDLHTANHSIKNLPCETGCTFFCVASCVIMFCILHLVDLICFLFAIYYDGYGSPFY